MFMPNLNWKTSIQEFWGSSPARGQIHISCHRLLYFPPRTWLIRVYGVCGLKGIQVQMFLWKVMWDFNKLNFPGDEIEKRSTIIEDIKIMVDGCFFWTRVHTLLMTYPQANNILKPKVEYDFGSLFPHALVYLWNWTFFFQIQCRIWNAGTPNQA